MQKTKKTVNPWTGKQRSSNQKGTLNQIMNKYYSQYESTKQNSQYNQLSSQIKNIPKSSIQIDQYKQIFNLEHKVTKLDEMINWINKVQNHRKNYIKQENKQVPIDSSYIYLPAYSGTTFHQLIKDSISYDKNNIISDAQIRNLKKQIQQIQEIINIQTKILKAVL